ncbi:cysteine desulfurase family protein [Arthrobacter crystallopoietes]|uniref:cysteine desulfurase n=1 Tax=Crystallibacter crystallopoietes TaxID=37928 RepID=A0A1H1FR78_9MICC|nr:cysteine desulfurase family protein [Arthrobacter crystallopoietes]AUI52956.1 cysteine desulfurase [Arthrobacter crystallopoietes]SDR03390.1 cysteine desulfurase [Arthrobacter crystallopoietes]
MIYLDAAATAPVRQEVLEAMWPALTQDFGNPSSHHTVGEAAGRALEYARRTAAQVLGCRPGEIVFTSGGTEANNLAIKGLALASPRGKRIVASAVEHPSVLEAVEYLERLHGFTLVRVPVDPDGVVDLEVLAAELTPETTLCTVMYANNEVGTIQPVEEIARLCREAKVPFHTDAVQAAGWLDLDVSRLGVDALSISGHKLGAPKGCGLLYVSGRRPLEPLVHGGGQENGRRSGTENVAGAVAVATALSLAEKERAETVPRVTGYRDYLIEQVLKALPEAQLTGHRTGRLPASASFCFPGTSGEAVLLELERRGVVCSSGSACAAGSDEPSAVLLAIGIDPAVAQTAVRLTFTAAVKEAEIALAVRAVVSAVKDVRKLAP